MSRIDLIWLGADDPPPWSMGRVRYVPDAAPVSLAGLVESELSASDASACLFWDAALGAPDEARVRRTMDRPGHLWHAGLRMGMAGLPGMIDFVQPSWILVRDPDPQIEATSWRMSLRCCLVRTDLLRRLGGPHPDFRTLEGASLEMGHRYINGGALARHVPELMEPSGRNARAFRHALTWMPGPDCEMPLEDELRFVRDRYGTRWLAWAVARAALTGYARPVSLLGAWRRISRDPDAPRGTVASLPESPHAIRSFGTVAPPPGYRSDIRPGAPPARSPRVLRPPRTAAPPARSPHLFRRQDQTEYLQEVSVSVLIPTIDRYPYLRAVLDQMREQTKRPAEVIVVDQTPEERRDRGLAEDFGDLPLRVLYQDEPGQCTARNAGLHAASGEFVLLLDDDVDVPEDLVEAHLRTLAAHRADVSSGVAREAGIDAQPESFRIFRASDVFPAGNTMLRAGVLRRSGLFNPVYDLGERADKDLGIRAYLSGALMVLNPDISVFHHRAPRGGLRVHDARKTTYDASRRRLFKRQLPSATELYLLRSHFSTRQAREAVWMRVFGTFSGRGSVVRRFAKALTGLLFLPHTLAETRRRRREAASWTLSKKHPLGEAG